MTRMPSKQDFHRNLEDMRKLELTQAGILAEIVQELSQAERHDLQASFQAIYEDELRHERELKNIQALLER